MFFKKGLIEMLGVTSVLLAVSMQTHAADIQIATDYRSALLVQDLIEEFISDYDSDSHIGQFVAPSRMIKDFIIDPTAKSDVSGPIDLFISANTDAADLYYKYQFSNPNVGSGSTFANPNVVVGKPFVFATDSVILYSSWRIPVDVSTGFPSKITGTFAMADPVTDAYGAVSAKLLAEVPNYKTALSHAQIYQEVGVAMADVEIVDLASGGSGFGFIAKSNVCTSSRWSGYKDTYESGSHHYDFQQNGKPLAFNSIPVTGVTVHQRNLSKEQNNLLTAFVQFMMGRGPNAKWAIPLIKEHCYTPASGNPG